MLPLNCLLRITMWTLQSICHLKRRQGRQLRINELCGKSRRTGGEPERLVWEKINDGGRGRERSCGAMTMTLNFILKARSLIIKWKNLKYGHSCCQVKKETKVFKRENRTWEQLRCSGEGRGRGQDNLWIAVWADVWMAIPRILIQNPGEERVHVGEAEPEFRFGHTKVETPGKCPTGDGWWAVGLTYKLDLCHSKVKIRKWKLQNGNHHEEGISKQE